MGWVGQKAGFQWCYGVSVATAILDTRVTAHATRQVQCIAAAMSVALNVLVLRETRPEKLLARRAAKLTKATGVKHVCKADLQQHRSFLTALRVSTLRPLSEYTVVDAATLTLPHRISLHRTHCYRAVALRGLLVWHNLPWRNCHHPRVPPVRV